MHPVIRLTHTLFYRLMKPLKYR